MLYPIMNESSPLLAELENNRPSAIGNLSLENISESLQFIR